MHFESWILHKGCWAGCKFLCLQRIINTQWPDRTANTELWKKSGEKPLLEKLWKKQTVSGSGNVNLGYVSDNIITITINIIIIIITIVHCMCKSNPLCNEMEITVPANEEQPTQAPLWCTKCNNTPKRASVPTAIPVYNGALLWASLIILARNNEK